jgi:ABC-type transport system involved in multi-copper enzyme maturation permease subunit
MFWFTWRQFRVQAIAAGVALTLLSVYLLFLGRAIRRGYSTDVVGCSGQACQFAKDQFEHRFNAQIVLTTLLMIAVPGVLGVFWGAPLVAREFEAGTHRLVWGQSVTRGRWLAVKLAVIAGACVVVTGLFSLLLSWAASPFDRIERIRFVALVFAARGVTPLSYAVFAFVLGSTIGLLVRRTVVAMALTLVVFAVVQLVMPFVVRPHLMPAKTITVPYTADTMKDTGLMFHGDQGLSATVGGYQPASDPTAWVLDSDHRLLRADGSAAGGAQLRTCLESARDVPATPPAPAGTSQPVAPDPVGGLNDPDPQQCLTAQNLHFQVRYQPSSRYWAFQAIETAIFLGLSAGLAGFCFRRISRGQA